MLGGPFERAESNLRAEFVRGAKCWICARCLRVGSDPKPGIH